MPSRDICQSFALCGAVLSSVAGGYVIHMTYTDPSLFKIAGQEVMTAIAAAPYGYALGAQIGYPIDLVVRRFKDFKRARAYNA